MIQFAPSKEPVATVIVVAWRQAPLLLKCLSSIAERVDAGSYEVLVVLNEPSADLQAQVEREVMGATVMPFRANLGFGGAVNYAASKARGRYLVLLNDDCVVEMGWLYGLIETAERRPRCGIVGSTFLHPDGTLQEAGSILWSDGTTSAVGDGEHAALMYFERKVDYCSGGSLLVRRDLWESVGGFDDRYYPAYHEDVDMCLRAQDLGWEVWYQPQSVVRHVRSASSGKLRLFLDERSRNAFCARWYERLRNYEPRGSVEGTVWRARGRPRRVLVLDDYVPVPSMGAGFPRMFETLTLLASQEGVQVDVHPRVGGETAPQLIRLGVRVVTDLQAHLQDPGVSYDTVIVSRPPNYDVLRSYGDRLGSARVVYDAEALFFRRLEMQATFEHDPSERRRLEREAVETRKREESIFRSVDAVVCISSEEAELVRGATDSSVYVIEPWLASPRPTTNGYEARRHLGLVAGWAAGSGSPNCDGLQWFAREVLPRVRTAVPGCRLLVTGSGPPPDVRWLEGPSVTFVGQVPDLEEFYEGIRVAISPTRFGAGVKIKTMEAIQYGVPLVATSEAADGLPRRLRSAVWVTDDPSEFADAVVALANHRQTWERWRQAELDQVAAAHDVERDPQLWVQAVFGIEPASEAVLAS